MSKVSAISVPVLSIASISKVSEAPFHDRVRVAKFGYDYLLQSGDEKDAQTLLNVCSPDVVKAISL